ncbi:MAG: ATP-dependent DNA ligase [Candidatus Eisenbacteria bacterium]|nr:ATP-dependent DNA ligase [Candidatus Eisenbacteria bacterium]
MSAKKGRSLIRELPDDVRGNTKRKPQPEWTSPMLATLVDEPFSDPDWLFERKLDGERCLAFKKGRSIRLMSRNKKELNDTYPELVDAFRDRDETGFIVDGEIVAFSGNVTSFERLQKRMQIRDAEEARESNVAVYYYLFDVLYMGRRDVTKLPLRDRKRLLRQLLSYSDPLRFTVHRNVHGESFLNEACGKRWEGLIAKKADSAYAHSRSCNWLKFKCVNRQEFVIGGYTAPEGDRVGFGALLVGYNEDGGLRYAGKVGTGYDEETLKKLGDRLKSLERKTPPFKGSKLPQKGVHWVTPSLVCEVGFTEWTDHKLRHPRYLGLRRDKDPGDVVRERPT